MLLQAVTDPTTDITQSISTVTHDFGEYIFEMLKTHGPGLVAAVLILIIGSWLIKRVYRLVQKILDKGSFDESLKTFLASLLKFALYVMLFITVLTQVGIPMTSFLTILGAAGLAIGLALQGSLSNFAGGVLILAFKPFKVGDVINAQNELGTVNKIDILHTHLMTPDNRLIVMPNGSLANSVITNITYQPKRRMELNVGISYGANIKKAKEIIVELLSKDPRVIEEHGVQVFVAALGDSSVDLKVRVWATKEDFWPLNFEALEMIKIAFDEQGIEIPFPQRVVHMKQG